jgi:hypothetical protein
MVSSNLTVLGFASMVYPTFTVLAYALIVGAILLAADWYVWGRTYNNEVRSPLTQKPKSDVIERFLERALATNGAGVAITEMNPASAMLEDERHGFKKVA